MKTVAVIAEYNPFHKGHEHQLKEIKRAFGEDSAIVVIMSGNFVQRGTPAILGKFDRARMAVECGASLVLELPFPYSAASAEYFAAAGVSIANDLGAVDTLSFGSECGDIALLTDAADTMKSPDFVLRLRERLQSKTEIEKGYPRVLCELLSESYGDTAPASLFLPNNILSISYILALKKLKSSIVPHTILRTGTDESAAEDGVFAGATHIRSLLLSGKEKEALALVPETLLPLWRDALNSGLAPVSGARFSAAILAHLRLLDASAPLPAECGGGVLSLLKRAAREAIDLDSLYRAAATKKYTHARLRRATLFSYFGVTPANVKAKPLYTQVLAMDQQGQKILANIRKTAHISLLTKPADLHKLSLAARAQAELSYRADSVYALLSPAPQKADVFLRTAPYRK